MMMAPRREPRRSARRSLSGVSTNCCDRVNEGRDEEWWFFVMLPEGGGSSSNGDSGGWQLLCMGVESSEATAVVAAAVGSQQASPDLEVDVMVRWEGIDSLKYNILFFLFFYVL